MRLIPGSLLLAGLGLAIAGLSPPRSAHGCAAVWGKTGEVTIADESAVIVWDEKTKQQHFIRRASFETRVPYFGFLVPTPTKPKFGEVNDELFQRLEKWTEPEIKKRRVYDYPSIGCAASRLAAPAGKADVEVVDRRRVAGQDVAVLKATKAGALREWMEKHGFMTRPDQEKWLEPYIQAGWFITASQVARDIKEEERLAMKAVRMTFETERPFFPYREPADQREEGARRPRLLRLFVIAGRRMEGRLEDAKVEWPGRAVWAGALTEEQRQSAGEQLGAGAAPPAEGAWLTVLEDRASPRPGVADLYFSPSADQSPLRRPPIIETEVVDTTGLWAGLCLLTFVAPLVLIWLWARRRSRAAR
jgi:hypothetical protein